MELYTKANKIGFVKDGHRDAKEIFQEAVDIISSIDGVKTADLEMLPDADVLRCQLRSIPFVVMNDLDYGVEVFCTDQEVLAFIESELTKK